MKKHIKSIPILLLVAVLFFSSCKKQEFSFGAIKTPTSLTLAAALEGADATHVTGNGSGNVTIIIAATDALTYKIDYGDGKTPEMVPSGVAIHQYATVGTSKYTITVNAIGTGGTMSTLSKQITVLYNFAIPTAIVTALTNDATRVWITDHDAPGHFGVGPIATFTPDYYSATPNSRDACAYDDEITFTKVATNSISINVDNKGQTFIIGAATSFYGQTGGDGCYTMSTGGTKTLGFSGASSGSSSSNSTGIQFNVPGNGIINFGTGANVYEILSISATNMSLRNIGADGNAWYQKLKAK